MYNILDILQMCQGMQRDMREIVNLHMGCGITLFAETLLMTVCSHKSIHETLKDLTQNCSNDKVMLISDLHPFPNKFYKLTNLGV